MLLDLGVEMENIALDDFGGRSLPSNPPLEASAWRRFVFFIFVLALFVALFIRRPEQTPPGSSNPDLIAQTQLNNLFFAVKLWAHLPRKLVVENEQDKTKWRSLQTQFDQKLEAINDLMSTYRPKSAISRFNESGDTKSFPVKPEFSMWCRVPWTLVRRHRGRSI